MVDTCLGCIYQPCSGKGEMIPSKLLQGKVQKQLEWKNQQDLQSLATKRNYSISSSQSWSLNAEDCVPATLRTAWAPSEWSSSLKRKFSLELRPFIQPGLSRSDWRIVLLSLFTMHSCQNASCALWLAHAHTHLANHHNKMVLKAYSVKYFFSLT